jgi:hypothetical protein
MHLTKKQRAAVVERIARSKYLGWYDETPAPYAHIVFGIVSTLADLGVASDVSDALHDAGIAEGLERIANCKRPGRPSAE